MELGYRLMYQGTWMGNLVLLLISLLLNTPLYFCHRARLTNWLKSDENYATACQGETTNLLCGDYEGIRILDAAWGRDDKFTCQSDDPLSTQSHTEICHEADKDLTYRKVAEQCQGRKYCFLIASPLFFDNTVCPHVRKYLRLKYECRQMSGMKRTMKRTEVQIFNNEQHND